MASRRCIVTWLAATAVAAMAGPAMAYKDFVIYFDLDSASFPDDSYHADIISSAINFSNYVEAKSFYVIDHAQDPGSPDHNIQLSQQRANGIVAALVKAGLDRALIRIQAAGDTQPATVAEAGVFDPLNRRVVFGPDWDPTTG